MGKKKLGWLGPAIVIGGLVVGAAGVWYMVYAKPSPGDVIDEIPVEGTTKLVVRAEKGGDRSFLELDDGDDVRWRALVPHYAGDAKRRGVAWGRDVVTIRVERAGREEVWVFGAKDAAKLAELHLAVEHEPIPAQTTGTLTLTDHIRSYEFVTGKDFHQVVGIDLSGKALWKVELGPEAITLAELVGGQLTIDQVGGYHRFLNVLNGRWYFPGEVRTNPAAQFRLPR
jgi:hypothetical protein